MKTRYKLTPEEHSAGMNAHGKVSRRENASEATVVSLSSCSSSRAGNDQLITPHVASEKSTVTANVSKKEIRITSSTTNVSVLTTQGTLLPSAATATSSCPEVQQKPVAARRSKRMTSAKLEYKRKQKVRLFVNPQKANGYESNLYSEEDMNDHNDFHTDSEFLPPHNIPKRNESSSTEMVVSEMPPKQIVYRKISSIFTSCDDSKELTYAYKKAYGDVYFQSNIEKEERDIVKRNELSKKNSPTSRPRTRSIYKEEEKELSRALAPTMPMYMSSKFQSEINLEMRAILVNWLISVANDLSFTHETIHTCVKLLDKALYKLEVTPETFHTFGCACLVIAGKLNEVKKTRPVNIAFFTDGSCSPNEICAMEMTICLTLGFDLQCVTAFHFLDHYLDVSCFPPDNGMEDGYARYNKKLHSMALLIVDASLLIPALVDVKDSLIAAASLYLARAMVGSDDVWNSHLRHHSGFEEEQMFETVSRLYRLLQTIHKNKNTKSLMKKYDTEKFLRIIQKVNVCDITSFFAKYE